MTATDAGLHRSDKTEPAALGAGAESAAAADLEPVASGVCVEIRAANPVDAEPLRPVAHDSVPHVFPPSWLWTPAAIVSALTS